MLVFVAIFVMAQLKSPRKKRKQKYFRIRIIWLQTLIFPEKETLGMFTRLSVPEIFILKDM